MLTNISPKYVHVPNSGEITKPFLPTKPNPALSATALSDKTPVSTIDCISTFGTRSLRNSLSLSSLFRIIVW